MKIRYSLCLEIGEINDIVVGVAFCTIWNRHVCGKGRLVFFVVGYEDGLATVGVFSSVRSAGQQLRGGQAHPRHHRHRQRRRTRMSQALLRRCIKSPHTIQHHRRWLAQQALARSSPDSPQESANETEPISSTAQSAATPTASPLKPSLAPNRKGGLKVDVFLASLQTTGSQPSLEDLERGRPREYAHPESALYAKQYNEVIEHLGRSFNGEQLRRFGEKCQLDPRLWRSGRRKVDYARAIVENAWGWPSLRDIEKRRRERTEVVTESKQISNLFSRLDFQPSPQLSTSHAVNCS